MSRNTEVDGGYGALLCRLEYIDKHTERISSNYYALLVGITAWIQRHPLVLRLKRLLSKEMSFDQVTSGWPCQELELIEVARQ